MDASTAKAGAEKVDIDELSIVSPELHISQEDMNVFVLK